MNDRFALAMPRLPARAFSGRRWSLGLAIMLFGLLGGMLSHGYAESLECPEIGPGWVPNLIGDATGGGLSNTGDRVDLANEISEAINTLQASHPNISWTTVQNVLLAAYCRVVSRTPGLPASEQWSRMRQFEGIVQQQIAADAMPSGALIVASVPLPPDVFRELRSQAAASHQPTAKLMADILSRAAGK